MDIAVLLALLCSFKLAAAARYKGQSKAETDSEDPRSAKAIFRRIYGPPVETVFNSSINRKPSPDQRVSSSQYPMIAAVYTLKVSKENVDDTITVFLGSGVIITEWVVLCKCSKFFSTNVKGEVVKIEDPASGDAQYSYPFQLVRAGHYFIPNTTGITSRTKKQEIRIRTVARHPFCTEFFGTSQSHIFDAAALELSEPLVFDLYKRPAAFYSLNSDFVEDKIEEMQDVNSRCYLVVPTEDGELYSVIVQIVSSDECNNILCMVGFLDGDTCREAYDFYEAGVFCTLRTSHDAPCDFPDGVLLCERQVFGFPLDTVCRACSPYFIAKPSSLIDLNINYVNSTEDTEDTEDTTIAD